jgi:hypothetical protein
MGRVFLEALVGRKRLAAAAADVELGGHPLRAAPGGCRGVGSIAEHESQRIEQDRLARPDSR